MRAISLAAVLLLVFAGAAQAKRKVVIMEPPVAYSCRQAPTWDLVATCLGKLGTVAVVRSLPDAKIATLAGGTEAVVLYTFQKAQRRWVLGGLYEGGAQVLDARAIVVGTHAGYQIDLGLDSPIAISVDDSGTATPVGRLRARHALFCGGAGNYRCAEAVVQCEASAHGRTYFTFRGTLSLGTPNEVQIAGDRSRAGGMCASQERLFLGWGP